MAGGEMVIKKQVNNLVCFGGFWWILIKFGVFGVGDGGIFGIGEVKMVIDY